MRTHVLTPPSAPIVSTADAKDYLGLYADLTSDDAKVAAFVEAATDFVETECSRAFALRSLSTSWDAPPYRWDGALRFPVAPVASVESVEFLDAAGVASTIDPAAYRFAPGTPGWVSFGESTPWPEGGVRVAYTAGYDPPEAIPAKAVHAVKMLVAHWFESRRPVSTGAAVADQPFAVKAFLGQLRWGNYPQ